MSFFHQTITLSDDEEEDEERISFESEVLAQVSTHSPTYSQWMEALFLSMFLVAVLIFVNLKASVSQGFFSFPNKILCFKIANKLKQHKYFQRPILVQIEFRKKILRRPKVKNVRQF